MNIERIMHEDTEAAMRADDDGMPNPGWCAGCTPDPALAPGEVCSGCGPVYADNGHGEFPMEHDD